jgi:cellulose synthase/poly-beta-1,6-N-acetylglucosamine synthase-like glycosyltransferase
MHSTLQMAKSSQSTIPRMHRPRAIAQGRRNFCLRAPELACLQGVFDFYNAGNTRLTRGFAVDYATWFRWVLPGLVRLGLVIPLASTTVFFRRTILEKIGRWDAHNATEDADLGMRLARRDSEPNLPLQLQ